MAEVIEMTNVREQDARARFSDYVQSVAFNLTLSRRMVETLRLIRDFGWPMNGTDEQWAESRNALRRSHAGGLADLTTPFRSLERRGLAYHDPSPSMNEMQKMPEDERKRWRGHRHYKLTTAGKLVCDLLVEAGLMPVAERKRKRA